MGADFTIIIPEIFLAVAAMALLMFGAYGGEDRRAQMILWISAVLLAGLGLWIGTDGAGTNAAFGGAFVDDAYSRFAKVLILFAAAIMLILGESYLSKQDILKFEYPILILLAVTGMMVMVSAGDLIVLYMGLELQSLSLYVVAAFNRDSARSTEAGLKYFVLGALSSGMLLYGASLIYGYTGTTRFSGIAEVVAADGVEPGLTFGLVFVCAALAFKISAAPFHMWTPDVYEGSPTPVTAFFATAPKAAAGVLFARVLYDGFGDAVSDWQQVLVFVAVASMFLGAVAAIGQSNLKRLLAYSSIGHMGYALVGLAAGTEAGAQSLLIYLSIYLVMNTGVFAFILTMERDGKPVASIADLAGLARTRPAQAMGLAILMFSLAGLPPLVGFFGKFYVFMAAVEAGLTPLAVAGAIASVIGAYYYLNIVKVMYLDQPDQPLQIGGRLVHSAALAVAAFIMAAGWLPLPLLQGFGVPEVALAVADTLDDLASGHDVALKWPNDVLLNGGKACGILLESLGTSPSGGTLLAIGIGLNLAHHPVPEDANWAPTSVRAETGTAPGFDTALDRLTTAMAHRIDQLASGGFAATRADWLARAVNIGQEILVRLPKRTLTGRFAGLDTTGALVLEQETGRRLIAAGDVFFPGAS